MNLISESKLEEANSVIDSLKLSSQNDPEYYVLVLNYYFKKAAHSYLSLQKNQPNDSLYLKLTDTTKQNVAGYIVGKTEYDLSIISEGLQQFKPALEKFQNRLDLYFGLIHLSRKCKLDTELKNTMLLTLDVSSKNNNQWLWSFNENLSENPKDFMLSNIQAYLNELFQDESESSDSIIVCVSDKLVELYPECIYGYNNLGAMNYFKNNHDKALNYFLKAEKIDPKDILVLSNIAQLSKLKNDISGAEKYYRKIILLGNEQYKSWAEEQIKLLNK
jgi:tetratricopeptide (TPR) repeat protein